MITAQQENIIKEITGRFNPSLIGVFGSYARNEQTHESDLDILLDFEMKVNLLELIGLEQKLTEVLGIKVDLVTMKSIHERLKPYIQQDLIRII